MANSELSLFHLIKDKWRKTPLHYAVEMDHTQSAKLFIEYPETDINAQNSNNDTALHECSYYGYLDICALLIEHGAILDLKNKQGQTPLESAVERKQYEISKIKEMAI